MDADDLKRILLKTKQKPDAGEEEDDTQGRPANRSLTRLHIALKDGTIESFQYHYLDAKSTFNGHTFVLLFSGARHWQVTVHGHGKNFWMAYDLITLHKLTHIKEATGSMPSAQDGDLVITKVEISDVTPKDR